MIEKMPEISIIVPVYNVEKYLPRCLDSILASTFKDFEVLLVDDCGPDNSRAICDEYAAKDARVKVISNSHNMGVSAARNNGLDNARGKYISFIDSDDYIDATMLEKLRTAIERNNVDMVGCNAWSVEKNGKKEVIKYLGVSKDTKTSFVALGNDIYKSSFHSCRLLIKKDIVENIRFPEGIPFAEDAVFLLEVYPKLKDIYFLAEPLYYYCKHFDNASLCRNAKNIAFLKLGNFVSEAFNRNPKSEPIREGFWQWYAANMAYVYNNLLPQELQGTFVTEAQKILPYGDFQKFCARLDGAFCNKKYYLFDFMPILTVKYRGGKKYVKLFGKIPLYKVKIDW